MIDCWGHRGASAAFPENTLASFEAAIRDGAEGIESDVHMSLDDVVVMFHDPSLERTTDGTGFIRERYWYGKDGMEHVRTKKEPRQAIPTFPETVELLMKPENQHVKLNVDVKIQSDPDRLFPLLHKTITSHENWETLLAPRILLGLWHPRFIAPAKSVLPYLKRSFIGVSLHIARKYFWESCEAFSIHFSMLTSSDGAKFRNECKAAGKNILVWTVNKPEHMMECVRWDVDAILTDYTKVWLELRAQLQTDYDKIVAQYNSRLFLWTSMIFYKPVQLLGQFYHHAYLESVAGPLDAVDTAAPGVKVKS
ncbi:PLC-like phosphodiesterase [Gloeophyllum trabeum ATCC 11539]|uniref:PLC-like phosphodiesterase n=1 Tax=Gloeophyllum trabeum (strain ATCC 11539 / FP-39264 / Madison 617) TaxID=670483 RepID=S7S028_GLOTA|nr:PLC-like phosphodiesterase [Gloeophyllum trabeum ATCC 11539]EPQ59044.1 PLC-like phosphodiesterase [Gloeophyllum trabeum ATCC 11539]